VVNTASIILSADQDSVDDESLLSLWLHGKSNNTRDAYLRDILQFSEFVDEPFPDVTLSDIQAFDTSLRPLKPSTRARKLSAVKSLLSFGHRIGYLRANVGAPVKAPAIRDSLSERILDDTSVSKMIAREASARNRMLMSFLYYGGFRVSEACQLVWGDLHRQRAGLQVSVFGKGGQTRQVLLPAHLAEEVFSLRMPSQHKEDPVFRSARGGGHLHRSQVYRIVRNAARRAGLDKHVSPHWLRHAHASHALDNGAPTHLVQKTLGHKSLATTGRYAHARPRDSSARFIRPLD
jgi:integrase/recombinase XerD